MHRDAVSLTVPRRGGHAPDDLTPTSAQRPRCGTTLHRVTQLIIIELRLRGFQGVRRASRPAAPARLSNGRDCPGQVHQAQPRLIPVGSGSRSAHTVHR